MMRGDRHRSAVVLVLGLFVLSGCATLRTNRAPIAAFTATPDTGYAPLDVTFDASESIDPDLDGLAFTWSFGDGATGSGRATTHTYGAGGGYDVVLRVADPGGLDDTATTHIDVHEVPEGYVLLQFDWTWGGAARRLDFAVSWNLYQTYRGRLRTPFVDNYDYGAFVADPLDDPTLEDLAALLRAQAGGDGLAYVELALAFVQGAIAYTTDPPYVEWPLYPIETLVDGEGDCEDTAILYVSLLKAREASCALAFVDTDDDGVPDHVLALVEVPDAFAGPGITVFERDGRRYAVAETASGPLDLGVDPWGLDAEDLVEIWPF